MEKELFAESRPVESVSTETLPVVREDAGSIVRLAVERNLDIDKLERLIDMRNREEERMAKRDFETHFAAMQSEFSPVKRTKKGDKSKYAPLDELVDQYGPIISRHGFSYSWSEPELENGRLRCMLTISGYGYSKQNYKDLPVYEPDKGAQSGKAIMNSLQAEGTRSTYGQRYTFKAGFGITETDEDTDGSFDDGVNYAEFIRQIKEVKSLDALKVAFAKVYGELTGDKRGQDIVCVVKDEKKKELTGGTKN